jgi:hypothetical protein
MADSDQKSVVFDQGDILGLIIPGAALIFGFAPLFVPLTNLGNYASKANFGSLGIVVLAASVAGQCLRVVAWTYFDKVLQQTPRRVFESLLQKLPLSEQTTIVEFVGKSYAIRFASSYRFLDLSMFSHIYGVLRNANRADGVDRMERQFRMVSGLFIAAIAISAGLLLSCSRHHEVGNLRGFIIWAIVWFGLLTVDRLVETKLATWDSRWLPYTYLVTACLMIAGVTFTVLYYNVRLSGSQALLFYGLLALATFLYVAAIRFANASASALIMSFSALIAERQQQVPTSAS